MNLHSLLLFLLPSSLQGLTMNGLEMSGEGWGKPSSCSELNEAEDDDETNDAINLLSSSKCHISINALS